MKGIIEIECFLDGEQPSKEVIETALLSLIKKSCIFSETIDGTDDWELIINGISVSVTETEK